MFARLPARPFVLAFGLLSLTAQAVQPPAKPPTAPLPTSPAAQAPGGTLPASDPADFGDGVGDTVEGLAPEPDPAVDAARLFQDPPGAVQLAKEGRLWVDKQSKQVIVDGYVAMQDGMLEMFACPAGTKEHESVVALMARSRDVHTGLLAVGAQKGTPVQWVPRYVPATGQAIRIWVMWYDEKGKLNKADARTWVAKTGTKETLKEDWVFAGSSFWKDPSDGVTYYEADGGDMICVSNFASAMLDLPVVSSKDTGSLQFSAFKENVPTERTFVRILMIPIPLPSDQPQPLVPGQADPNKPPADKWLQLQPGIDPTKPRDAEPSPAAAPSPVDAPTDAKG